MQPRVPLHLVPSLRRPPVDEGRGGAAPGDVGLLVFLLALNLVPVAGLLGGGRWGPASAGLGTATIILCARELAHELWRWRRRARR